MPCPFPFAWYQVTQGVASATGTKSNIAVATQVVSSKDGIAAALTVNAIEIDEAGKKKGESEFASRANILQLIGFDDHAVVHKYYNGTTLVPYSGEAGKKDFAVYEITIQAENYKEGNVVVMTAAQISEALKTKTLGLSVEADHDQLDAYFVAPASVPTSVTDNASTVNGYTVQNEDDLTSATTIAYMVVYAKGNIATSGNETNNEDNPVTGNYTVTVSYTAPTGE